MVDARLIPFILLLFVGGVGCGSTPAMMDAGTTQDSSTDVETGAADAAPVCQGCASVCYQGICAKRLFASSRTYDGVGIQSTKHADDECGAMAKGASMNGYWLAWISDELGSSPAARFGAPYPGPYVLANNPTILVVKTADDFSKKLEHAIDHDENGMLVGGFVWTQTDAFGDVIPSGVASGDACTSWSSKTTTDAAMGGIVGIVGWSTATTHHCDESGRIYCFEQ